MIVDEIRYRLRRSRMRHPHAWLTMYVIVFANAGAAAIIVAYNAGMIR